MGPSVTSAHREIVGLLRNEITAGSTHLFTSVVASRSIGSITTIAGLHIRSALLP
jgi:hypothetical protein